MGTQTEITHCHLQGKVRAFFEYNLYVESCAKKIDVVDYSLTYGLANSASQNHSNNNNNHNHNIIDKRGGFSGSFHSPVVIQSDGTDTTDDESTSLNGMDTTYALLRFNHDFADKTVP